MSNRNRPWFCADPYRRRNRCACLACQEHLPRRPFNPQLHQHLFPLGYELTQHDEDYEDQGDAETGPMLVGHPAWDEYASSDEIICIDADGRVVHREARDLQLEKWLEENVA